MTDHFQDPRAALTALSDARDPLLIGVRHHSPALSAAMPHLLDEFAPERVLIELPVEFAHWLPWLGDPGLLAPVALAAVRPDADGLWFYPFADYSPELAAVRWAVARGIPVEPFDLAAGARANLPERAAVHSEDEPPAMDALEGLHRAARTSDFESLWDRLVEVHAADQTPEAVRRAGLYVGWALRRDSHIAGQLQDIDRVRETAMRRRLDELGAYQNGARVAVVVGAFHCPALLAEPTFYEPLEWSGEVDEVVTSLIPYSFELLDSRSGYPAGIRDPMWQQRVWQAMSDGEHVDEVVSDAIVSICRNIRKTGHVAGVPDADAAMRMAKNLAAIRGLAAPGRQELVESIQSSLGHGEPLGRALVLARAMEAALVGRKRGRLAMGTPRSGLYPRVIELLGELRLPGPESMSAEPTRMRLDPMRSDLDRRRHIALKQLCACHVPYATEQAGQAIGLTETLTRLWDVRWQAGTEAVLEVASLWGVRLDQAAAGALRVAEQRLSAQEKWTAQAMLAGTRAAAECGLVELTVQRLAELAGPFLEQADLVLILEALALLELIEHGHVPGFPANELLADRESRAPRSAFLEAAVRSLEGIAGSERLDDARALISLVSMFQSQPEGDALGQGRLAWIVARLADEGSPMMQGAGCAARLLMGAEADEVFADRLGSWVDAANSPESMRALAGRLNGLLVAAGPLLEGNPDCLAGLVTRVEALGDADFLRRLPHLRDGFSTLSPAARQRFLETLSESFPELLDPRGHAREFVLDDHPELLGFWTTADREAMDALRVMGLVSDSDSTRAAALVEGDLTPAKPVAPSSPQRHESREIEPLARWRLILGREREKLSTQTCRAARALDELYGQGEGEGAHGDLTGGGGGGSGQGGGKEEAFPNVREWADELEALFGQRVRDEVLGKAAERGRTAALLEINPDTVAPSMQLLEQVLSLKGSLPESKLGQLRKLIDRIVGDLVKELATRVKPALTGMLTPRPTRRRGGPVDLKRTIERNLKHAQPGEPDPEHPHADPGWQLIPETIFFKTRARPATDWHIILVVDVSGSMEASTIYSAMMAAIFAGLPSVQVNFLAFNTEVIDLSDQVEDPLSLLLEVEVGGGTHIAKAMRYARDLIRVPSRSLVILVSDFEEGWGVSGLVQEVRAIVESGAQTLGIAALDDVGKPRFNRAIAEMVAGEGMPVAALTPLELAGWVGDKIHGR